MKADTKAKVDAAMDKLLQEFSTGQIVPIARNVLTINGGNRPIDRWSFRNKMLAVVQGTGDARTFKQWGAVERKVNKGSKAIYILKPIMVPKLENGQPVIENGRKKMILIGFSGLPVFRVEDTDGAPLPTFEPAQPPPLHEVAESWGIKVQYAPKMRNALGSCLINGQEIKLFTHDERTFWHELAHAAHQRVLGKNLKGGQDPVQELVAELSAAVIAETYGAQDAAAASYNYLAGYAMKGGDKDLRDSLYKVINEVGKVLELIFTVKEALLEA